MHVNQKFAEIVFNLLLEQNKQLLKCIADDLKMDYKELVLRYVPGRQEFHRHMMMIMQAEAEDKLQCKKTNKKTRQ